MKEINDFSKTPNLRPHDWRYAGADVDKFFYRCDACGKESDRETHEPCAVRSRAVVPKRDAATAQSVAERV